MVGGPLARLFCYLRVGLKQSPLEHRIAQIVEPVVAGEGFHLVQVRMTSEAGSSVLQILIENPATRNIGIEDCARLSRDLAAHLDVEDPIQGRYRLEVSSPGIERPLTRPKDFSDFAGFEAKFEIFPPRGDQKRFRGFIREADNEIVRIETEDQGMVELDMDAIQKAKLVLTDETLAKMKALQINTPTSDQQNETQEDDDNGTAAGR